MPASSEKRASFAFRMVDGHPVARIGDLEVLIDSGSPVTIGNLDSIEILGHSYPMVRNQLGVSTDAIGPLIGGQIDVLLGADLLAEVNLVIDPATGRVTFSSEPLAQAGETLQVSLMMGVPSIVPQVAGQRQTMFLDTGAKISYISDEVVAGQPAAGEVEDFYPNFGSFRTEIHSLDTTIGGRTIKLRFGTLPAALRMALIVVGADGIVGSELLRYFAIGLSLGAKRVVLVPLG